MLVEGLDAKLGPENPGIRQEIRDLQKNGDLWNLYLLGLSELQRKDSNNSLSYFQIASMLRWIANVFACLCRLRYPRCSVRYMAEESME